MRARNGEAVGGGKFRTLVSKVRTTATRRRKERRSRRRVRAEPGAPERTVAEPGESPVDSMRQQTMIAVSLILVFALALLVAMFRFSPQEVMGIAGIFSAWITAIVAFFFVERGAQNTVRTTTENVAKLMKAREEEMAARGSLFAEELRRQLEEFARTRERREEDMSTTDKLSRPSDTPFRPVTPSNDDHGD